MVAALPAAAAACEEVAVEAAEEDLAVEIGAVGAVLAVRLLKLRDNFVLEAIQMLTSSSQVDEAALPEADRSAAAAVEAALVLVEDAVEVAEVASLAKRAAPKSSL